MKETAHPHIRCPAHNSVFSRRPTCKTCFKNESPVHQSARVLLNSVNNNTLINKVHVTLALDPINSVSLYCEGESRYPIVR
jgi:hypothetical protein